MRSGRQRKKKKVQTSLRAEEKDLSELRSREKDLK